MPRLANIENKIVIPKLAHVKLLGIEFEGGWNRYPETNEFTPRLVRDIKEDGSVTVRTSGSVRYVGEITSRPITINELPTFIDQYIPDTTNSSCGLHVHMSFHRSLDVLMLASNKFADYWNSKIDMLTHTINLKSKRIDDRLKDTYYAKRIFDGYSGLNGGGSRYRQVNHHAYRQHGTVEFRVLGGMSRKHKTACYKSILYLIGIVEGYLDQANVQSYDLERSDTITDQDIGSMQFDKHKIQDITLLDTDHNLISNEALPRYGSSCNGLCNLDDPCNCEYCHNCNQLNYNQGSSINALHEAANHELNSRGSR